MSPLMKIQVILKLLARYMETRSTDDIKQANKLKVWSWSETLLPLKPARNCLSEEEMRSRNSTRESLSFCLEAILKPRITKSRRHLMIKEAQRFP